MSFSEQIKGEILQDINLKNCCKKSMRLGELSTEGNSIKIIDINHMVGKKNCCIRSYLKGVFLGSGCIVSPESKCHFEVSVKSKLIASYIVNLLSTFDVQAKVIKRLPDLYVIYLKDSEQIAMVLRILNAPDALMNFENIKIEKSIKNGINRTINCETANIEKTVNAAYEQIVAIEKIMDSDEFNILPIKLKEMCLLRKKNPEVSLQELADMCEPKISKSGAYHRLNKLIKIGSKL